MISDPRDRPPRKPGDDPFQAPDDAAETNPNSGKSTGAGPDIPQSEIDRQHEDGGAP